MVTHRWTCQWTRLQSLESAARLLSRGHSRSAYEVVGKRRRGGLAVHCRYWTERRSRRRQR